MEKVYNYLFKFYIIRLYKLPEMMSKELAIFYFKYFKVSLISLITVFFILK